MAWHGIDIAWHVAWAWEKERKSKYCNWISFLCSGYGLVFEGRFDMFSRYIIVINRWRPLVHVHVHETKVKKYLDKLVPGLVLLVGFIRKKSQVKYSSTDTR